MLAMVLLSACSGGASTDPTDAPPSHQPTAVVQQWLDAIAASDTAALNQLVEPVGLAVLAGVENALRSDELVALLGSGFTPQLSSEYWSSFRDDFEAIRGLSVGALVVGEETALAGEVEATAVEIMSPEANGSVILRRSGTAGWQIDSAATVGPALIGPLADYLLSALEGPNADAIAAAYREGILPGLDAATVADPDNKDLAFETEFIRQLLDR